MEHSALCSPLLEKVQGESKFADDRQNMLKKQSKTKKKHFWHNAYNFAPGKNFCSWFKFLKIGTYPSYASSGVLANFSINNTRLDLKLEKTDMLSQLVMRSLFSLVLSPTQYKLGLRSKKQSKFSVNGSNFKSIKLVFFEFSLIPEAYLGMVFICFECWS